jgi:hypothetical protein
MNYLVFLTICLFTLTENAFCQYEQKGELILAYDPKSDSIYGKDTYCISLYYCGNSKDFYLVYSKINYLENFEYLCRFGPNDKEYFVFSSTSSPADETKLLYWCSSTKELFSCDIVGEYLMPVETSFKPERLTINCISVDKDDCGAIHQIPVKLEKKIAKKDFIGNKLPPYLKLLSKWEY